MPRKRQEFGNTTDIYFVRRNGQPIRLQKKTSMLWLSGILDELKPKDFEKQHQDKLAQADEFRIFKQL